MSLTTAICRESGLMRHAPAAEPGLGKDDARAVEQAVEVTPLPVAVFLGRVLEGPLPRTAILQLLGGRGRGDARAVTLPCSARSLTLALSRAAMASFS